MLRASMPAEVDRSGRDSRRFIVQSVYGFVINQGSGTSSGGAAKPRHSFTVLDSAWCYRIVGEFNTGQGTYGSEIAQERKALELCERLNAWEKVTRAS